METKNDGGAAFPQFAKDPWGATGTRNTGMALRDYFAAQALAGIASQYHEQWAPERVGPVCYELADALLAERAK